MFVLILGLFSRANIQYVLIRAHGAFTAPRSAAQHASHYNRTIVAAGALWAQMLRAHLRDQQISLQIHDSRSVW